MPVTMDGFRSGTNGYQACQSFTCSRIQQGVLSLYFRVGGALVEENGVRGSECYGYVGHSVRTKLYNLCRPYCTSVESGPREGRQHPVVESGGYAPRREYPSRPQRAPPKCSIYIINHKNTQYAHAQ
jgi:hypothetical protein